jgi:hypothetical protein
VVVVVVVVVVENNQETAALDAVGFNAKFQGIICICGWH